MKPFQFLTIRPALIIGVQFKLQNLYYFGLSATNFPSLDVKILTTSGWVRHLFPHWTCRRVEEISNAPRVRNILVYSSREDLEIFGSSEIGLLSRVWGLCALQCSVIPWAPHGPGCRGVFIRKPQERDRNITPAASPGAGPCVSECLVTCSQTGVGELHMGPTPVTIIWVSAVSTSPGCGPDGVTLTLLSPTSQISLVSLATVPA